MKIETMKFGFLGIAALAAVSVSSDRLSAESKPIVIGFPAALTGPLSAWDSVILSAAQLWISQANAGGGIDGRKFELKVVDYASVPANVVTLGNQLINQGADVLFGGTGSAANSALIPIAARNNVPLLAVSVLAGDLKWAFTATGLGENGWGKAEFGFFKDTIKADSIGLIYFANPFGQGAAKVVENLAAENGVKVSTSIGIDPFVSDLSSEMQRVKDSGAKALLSFAGGVSHIVLAKAAANTNLNIPIVFSIDSKERVVQAMEQYSNIYTLGLGYYSYPEMTNPAMKVACDKFIPELRKINSINVYSVSGYAYDFLSIYAKAIKASGATTGEKLRSAIENTSYVGCASQYKFSASDHSGQKSGPDPVVTGQWQKDGTFKTLWVDK